MEKFNEKMEKPLQIWKNNDIMKPFVQQIKLWMSRKQKYIGDRSGGEVNVPDRR